MHLRILENNSVEYTIILEGGFFGIAKLILN